MDAARLGVLGALVCGFCHSQPLPSPRPRKRPAARPARPCWNGRPPAGPGASCHFPYHHQAASGLRRSSSDLSGWLRNLENLTLPAFVMLRTHPEKKRRDLPLIGTSQAVSLGGRQLLPFSGNTVNVYTGTDTCA